ncbi:PEP-CTERM sorting domain-containing protein [Rheinheimera sp. D18]|uniref:SGNH/GDSL hydrolase family protein n=1 Tax=Rheinheimera sp. D18 TaxID=2545632 RepID=UPI001050639E|nr:SGNH/GDSL hydrolase family protein [Rheinheimera sp. D18]QBL08589.1 PEP-CTERM sorting domain-containing protein [Rheinheimera sp. D18]
MKTIPSFLWLKCFVLSISLTLLTLPVSASIIFSDIYIFGDSLSDTGNTKATVPLGSLGPVAALAGYGPNGRFSNGNVWHEYLASDLALSTTRSTSGGNNFAYGGARIDNTSGVSTGVLNQYDQYLNRLSGSAFDADALYIAWAGGNDMRDLVGVTSPLMMVTSIIGNFQMMLTDMIARGAMTLLVPNLPDLGSIPEFAATAESFSGHEVSMLWNSMLEDMLINLAKNSDAQIYMLDVRSIFDGILADPLSEGFSNTTDQCRSVTGGLFASERTCANVSQYVFWDEIHPTSRAHGILGREAYALLASGITVYQQVPEPATLVLFLLGVGYIARRKRFH